MPQHRRSSHPPPPPHHRHQPLPSSSIAATIRPAKIEALLAPWVPDAEERAFAVRCIVGEGPLHHRGASYALLSLLGLLLEAAGPAPATPPLAGETVPVPMRLPPHLAPRDDHFPIELPLAPLFRLAPKGSPELQALQALTERAGLVDIDGRPLRFGFFEFLPIGLLSFTVILGTAFAYVGPTLFFAG